MAPTPSNSKSLSASVLSELVQMAHGLGKVEATIASHHDRLTALERQQSERATKVSKTYSPRPTRPSGRTGLGRTLMDSLRRIKDHLGFIVMLYKIIKTIPWGVIALVGSALWKGLSKYLGWS